jgi:hypothetical protein
MQRRLAAGGEQLRLAGKRAQMILVPQEGQPAAGGFREAVDLHDFAAESGVPVANHRRARGLGAVHDLPQRRGVIVAGLVQLQHALQQRRHQDGRGGALRLQQLEPAVGLEIAIRQHHTHAVHEAERVQHDADAGRRARRQEHVLVPQADLQVGVQQALAHAALRPECALGQAGGAGGIADAGVVVVGERRQRRARVVASEQRFVVEVEAVRTAQTHEAHTGRAERAEVLTQQRHAVVLDDQHPGSAVVDQVQHLAGRVAPVHAHPHGADLEAREPVFQHLDVVVRQDRHRVALADAHRLQGGGEAVRALMHLAPGAADRAVHEGDLVRVAHGAAAHEIARQDHGESPPSSSFVIGGI